MRPLRGMCRIMQEAREGFNKREIIYNLFTSIMVSLLNSRIGILRIIDKRTMRTVTEWKYPHEAFTRDRLKLSNKSTIIQVNEPIETDTQCGYITGDEIDNLDTICVLGFAGSVNKEIDTSFIKTLLNQIHFLVIVLGITSPKKTGRKNLLSRLAG